MEPNKFRLYGFLELKKSAAASRRSPDNSDEYIVTGRIVDEREDLQGETPHLEWFDWTYFDKTGVIKYEHDPLVVVSTPGETRVETHPDPDNIIGVPLKRWREGNAMYIKGALLPGRPMTDKVIALAQAYEQYNKAHPENERHLQFSVEGDYNRVARKRGKKFYGGRVEGVVVTPQGMGPTTKAEVKRSNERVFKSLEAGYAISPDTMKGGGALRREDLEGSTKNLTIKEPTMKFHTHAEACEHFKKSGDNEEEAKKKADKYFADRRKEEEEADGELEKSLNSQTNILQKSLEAITSFTEMLEDGQDDVQDFQKSLRKSIAQNEAGHEIDGTDFLLEQANAIATNNKLMIEGLGAMMKSLTALVQAGISNTAVVAGQNKKINDLQESVRANVESTQTIVGALRKSTNGVRTTGLERVVADPDAHGNDSDEDSKIKMLKSVGPKRVEEYFVNKAISLHQKGETEQANTYFKAQEQLQTSGSVLRLSKSLQAEVIEAFKLTAN